ncbi:MAG: YigZ family protein [Clostridia bacterium]|nr:YigZ family protein [Clostridia bacterium]
MAKLKTKTNEPALPEEPKYITLAREAEAEFEEKRSRFIGRAAPVKTEAEAEDLIRRVKADYPGATHYVWAYTMRGGAQARYTDDGEPSGTAGRPVLDVIVKSGCDDACVVVVRYFGGTLLGAGGLVRAYAHSAAIALEAAQIVAYEKYTELSLTCGYGEYQKYIVELERVGAIIDDTVFADAVTVRFAVRAPETGALCDRIRELSAGRDEAVITGERFACGV